MIAPPTILEQLPCEKGEINFYYFFRGV